jgi:pimeloyl-ACP methyl ester carboxylesterase
VTIDSQTTDAPTATRSVDLTGIAFSEPEFDGQFLRALDAILSGGADIGECFVTARRIDEGDHDGWYREWSATADRVYADAEASLAAGHRVSAQDGFLRAATYHRTSGVFFYRPPIDPRFVDSYRRQRDAFRRAAALSEWRIEQVAVPYENTSLDAYFITPHGDGPFPAIIMIGGYDGTKEESYFAGGLGALRRGYAVLLIDGPGQGGALIEQGLVFRPDWEAVVTPQVQWLIDRSDVDAGRIVLMGRSWGGYLAPRAATAEHRVAAVIADAPQFTPGEGAVFMLPPEYRDQLHTGDPDTLNAVLREQMTTNTILDFGLNRGMLTHGLATPLDYLQKAKPYTLRGLAEQITCPTLLCSGENDSRGGGAEPLYDALVAPKKHIAFTNAEGAGEHDEAGAAGLFEQRVFDWLDETLSGVAPA